MTSTFYWAAALIALPAVAMAQPDPFEAYESARKPAPKAEPVAAPAPAARPRAPLVQSAREGTIFVGAGVVFNFTNATNELEEGGEATNSTYFLKLNPSVGYFITDNIELGAAAGLLARELDRGDGETTTDNAWLISVTGRYFQPFSNAFSLYAGGAIGGAFGGSSRGLPVVDAEGRDRILTEQTDTSALMLGADVGAAYMIRPQLQLRASVDLTWLTGSESITSLNKDLSVSTVNTGLGIGIHGAF